MADSNEGFVARVKSQRTRSELRHLLWFTRTRKFGFFVICLLTGAIIVASINGASEDEDSTATTIAAPDDIRAGSKSGVHLPLFTRDSSLPRAATRTGQQRRVAATPKLSGPTLLNRPRDVALGTGVIVKAVLLSGASNGPVKAALTEPVLANGEELVEAGALLVGTGQSSEERLLVHFSKLVFKDGTSLGVEADAVDASDKTPGIKGARIGHYATKVAGSVGLNFISGIADGLQETQSNGFVAVKKPSVKNALLNGASRSAVEESTELMSSLKSAHPVIEVPEGTPIYVMVTGKGND